MGIDMDYCQNNWNSGKSRNFWQQKAHVTAILFHEATHRRTQSKMGLATKGVSAYALANPHSEWALERPIYEAERNFLQAWKNSIKGPCSREMRSAIQEVIDDAQWQIDRLDNALKDPMNSVKSKRCSGLEIS
jgi:hypothetical protein